MYQSAGTGISTAAYTLPNGAASNSLANYAQMYNEIFGIVTQTQLMYTRSGANLALNPIGTPGFDKSVLPSYSAYFSDTWHMKPTLTLTYGVSWDLSMPPYEIDGKQVSMVDAAGNPIDIKSYMLNKQSAALKGQVYNPTIGFATIGNVNGGTMKYPYNPFYGGFSPRVSVAWNPHAGDGIIGKILGNNNTVIRGGYGRIYGRLNGVDLLLVPLLGPGLLQAVSCVAPTSAGVCAGSGGANPATAFRIGTDGLSAPLPQATPTLPQPFYPGTVQNGVLSAAAADGSQLDPKMRPNHSDEYNFTIQRSFSSKMVMEVGYIGRKIANEFQEINIDAIPWMTTLNGQSFAQAWANVYNQICPPGPSCSASASSPVTPQPFFEAAMGGSSSPYCAGSASCTAAVVKNEAGNIRTTLAYQTWLNLNRAPGWTLGRTVQAAAGTGQSLTGAFDFINSYGHGSYNAAFMSFTVKDWHGMTARSNFTWGRALGTGSVTQSSSSITVPNPYDFNTFGTYGTQPFDVKFTYSLLMLYQPRIERLHGVLGYALNGWTIAPLFTARTGLPQRVSVGGNAQAFGEIYSGQSANYEEAAGNGPFTGGNSANYNVKTSRDLRRNQRQHRRQHVRRPLRGVERVPPPDSRTGHEFRRCRSDPRLPVLESGCNPIEGLQGDGADRRYTFVPVRERFEPLRTGGSDHQYRHTVHLRCGQQSVHDAQRRSESFDGVRPAAAFLKNKLRHCPPLARPGDDFSPGRFLLCAVPGTLTSPAHQLLKHFPQLQKILQPARLAQKPSGAQTGG